MSMVGLHLDLQNQQDKALRSPGGKIRIEEIKATKNSTSDEKKLVKFVTWSEKKEMKFRPMSRVNLY